MRFGGAFLERQILVCLNDASTPEIYTLSLHDALPILRARLESPRASYATPGFRIGTTRAPRRRQLPTKRCHAALLFGATRAYQPDSSSKPLHRQPRAGVLGKSSMPTREILGR